jgi:hypothetical protein
LVNFVFVWYIFPVFGILYQEKSGNPERPLQLARKLLEWVGAHNMSLIKHENAHPCSLCGYAGLPDLSWYNVPKRGKFTKWW